MTVPSVSSCVCDGQGREPQPQPRAIYGVLRATPGDRSAKNNAHNDDSGMVLRLYAYDNVSSIRLIEQTATRILPMNTCKVSLQYEFFYELLSGSFWCKLCHMQGIHNDESVGVDLMRGNENGDGTPSVV